MDTNHSNWKHTLFGCGVGLALGFSLNAWLNKQKKDDVSFIEGYVQKKKGVLKSEKIEKVSEDQYSSKEYKQMINEQLVRNIQFFGEAGQEAINNSYVIIFGVGGVGSHVVSSLARSGISRLKLIDFDQVSLSSLNRHAFATQQDVGTSKAQCIKNYIHKIMPHTQVNIIAEYVTKDNIKKFFQDEGDQSPSYVIDCIDNIDAKVYLLEYCKKNNLKVISSMGAGMKADPTRMQIRDISETNYDDLSRAVRTKLKKLGVHDGIKVVLSVERSTRELLPLKDHQENNVDEFKVFSNYRLRIVPVLGTMPAIVAYSISSYVLCDLAGQLYKPFQIDEVKQANYAKLFNHLQQEARKENIFYEDLEFDMEDVYILAREIYDWKEIVTDKRVCGGLLARWNPELPFTSDNFVFFNQQDAKKHPNYKKYSEVLSAYSSEVVEKVKEKQIQYQEFIKRKPVLYK